MNSEERPDISVIIPVYNQEESISRCLDSVCAQKGVSLEIICINDGSTDGTLSILRRWQEEDDRIVLIDQSNQGVGAARNNALDIAKGEFVVFCDGDDRIPAENVYARLYNAAILHGARVSAGGFSLVEESVGTLQTAFDGMLWGYTFPFDAMIEYAEYQFDYGFTRFLFERKLLLENKIRFPGYTRYEDPVFLVKALSAAERFYAITDVVYECYVGHQGFEWDAKRATDLLAGMTEVLAISKEKGLSDLHCLTIKRLEDEYAGIFGFQNLDESVFEALIGLNEAVDWEFIPNGDKKSLQEGEPRLVAPLRKAIKEAAWASGIAQSHTFKLVRYITGIPRVIMRKLGKGKTRRH